jgi:hypothetical protein
VHALLGYFLEDRDSPTPFPGRGILIDHQLFEWGVAPPLEKVITSPPELELLLGLPEIFRNSVSVIEPWENVGINLQGEAEKLASLPLDAGGLGLESLQRVCQRIAEVGDELPVIKAGEKIARGWNDTNFAVAPNEELEVGTRRLMPYRRRHANNHIPVELHDAHALVADELEGVIDTMMRMERELNIEMFHGDEVNEEAILFANWAYKLLHDTIVPFRHSVAVSPVSWLLCLPYALEILSQTRVDEEHWTEVSTTCIYYKDWETHTIRRSFTCQFHPELMADIRDIGKREGPRYKELKDNDGVRLLIRLLYHGMQE